MTPAGKGPFGDEVRTVMATVDEHGGRTEIPPVRRSATLTRPVRRQVSTTTGQPLVLLLSPEGIWLRQPRKRTAYLLPYGVAWVTAARLTADAAVRAKRLARKRK